MAFFCVIEVPFRISAMLLERKNGPLRIDICTALASQIYLFFKDISGKFQHIPPKELSVLHRGMLPG